MQFSLVPMADDNYLKCGYSMLCQLVCILSHPQVLNIKIDVIKIAQNILEFGQSISKY
jgi:hypothetical protein